MIYRITLFQFCNAFKSINFIIVSSVIFFLLITSKQELVPDHLRGVMKAGYWENKVGQYRTVVGGSLWYWVGIGAVYR